MFDTNNTLKSNTNNQLHAMNHITRLSKNTHVAKKKYKRIIKTLYSICISYGKFGWESTP